MTKLRIGMDVLEPRFEFPFLAKGPLIETFDNAEESNSPFLWSNLEGT